MKENVISSNQNIVCSIYLNSLSTVVESNTMPTCTITFNSPPQAAALRSNVQMHVRLALQHASQTFT